MISQILISAFTTILLVGNTPNTLNNTIDDCTFKGIPLHGKVQFVDAFPDIKIQYVTAFPDIKVKMVDAFPDDCGEWKEVDVFPDFKVQVVDAFPDIKVQLVDVFPGMN